MAKVKAAKSDRSETQLNLRIKPTCRKPTKKLWRALLDKMQTLDTTFKEHHYVTADEAMGTEQNILDEHKDKIFSYMKRLH